MGVAGIWLAVDLSGQAGRDSTPRDRQTDVGVGVPTVGTGSAPAAPPQAPLTRVAEIRTGDPSTLGRDVRIAGVVTYVDLNWSLLFVQDADEGVFVQIRGLQVDVNLGDDVIVEGRASAGEFAPMVEGRRVTRVGIGRMPLPRRPSFQELLTGDWDSQFIELDGIVRGIYPLSQEKNDHLLFEFVVGTWRVLAQLPGKWTGPLPQHLVDAEVRIRGVAGTLFNQQRQLVGLQLFIPTLDMVVTSTTSRPGPFTAPVHTIGSLNRWVTRHGMGRRVRVRGEVTWANGRQVYIRDTSGSIAVTLWRPATLSAGQQVDVAGFVAAGTYSPTLEDAVVQQAGGHVEPAAAMRVSVSELLTGRFDAGLVTLEAEVVNQMTEPDRLLVLKAGGQVFTAPGPPTGLLETFEPGTLVSVTGVCRVQVDPIDVPRVPRGFQVLLRTADDVRLVRRAALSPRRTVQALALLFAMVLAGLGWIVGLRRRVSQQTQDLREQLDRERALEAQYRELVATANDLVVICDADARVTSINEAGQRITGQSAELAIGRPLRDLVAAADRPRLDRELSTALAARTGTTLEVAIASASDTVVTLELDVRPIYRRSRPAGLQAIGRDVTARKRAEGDLAHARDAAEAASRAKSEFMANISHEVRTPLNGIIGMTELALASPMTEEPRQYLNLVRSSADSLLHIINDILDFSKVEAGHLQFDAAPFDLSARLTATLEPLAVTARRKGLSFDMHVDGTLPRVVVGDAGRFGQVLVNLVGNAVKFTSVGGVRVDVEHAPSNPGDAPKMVRVRASVRDTGIGIPADKHALIFEAFTQADGSTSRRFGGTGLGLSIAAKIVKRMGGTLQVASAPGEGSAFTLVMPFERGSSVDLGTPSSDGLSRLLGHAGAPPLAAGRAAQTPRPLRVLLVEDNPVNQRLAHEILRRRGHRVTVAENGREALERLSEGTFDIVLMDVQMPEMNGLDATAAIRAGERATGRHLPIVAMTAHAMAGDRERCLAAGMDEYLTKPIRAEALIGHVERFVMGAQPSSSGAPSRAFNFDDTLQRVDGDLDLLAEIAGLFLSDAPAMLADVLAAVAAGDAQEVARTAHRLKGSLLTFGAPAAADAALRLETNGRAGDLATAQADADCLAAETDRLFLELESFAKEQEKEKRSA